MLLKMLLRLVHVLCVVVFMFSLLFVITSLIEFVLTGSVQKQLNWVFEPSYL